MGKVRNIFTIDVGSARRMLKNRGLPSVAKSVWDEAAQRLLAPKIQEIPLFMPSILQLDAAINICIAPIRKTVDTSLK